MPTGIMSLYANWPSSFFIDKIIQAFAWVQNGSVLRFQLCAALQSGTVCYGACAVSGVTSVCTLYARLLSAGARIF